MVMLLLLGTLVGCKPISIVADYEPVYQAESQVELQVEYIPLEFRESTSLEMIAAPSYMEMDKIKDGILIDTWTKDGYIQLKNNRINYEKGSMFCIFIVNDNGEETTYKLQYMDARKDFVFDNLPDEDGSPPSIILNNGKGYAKAPIIVKNWITFPGEVTVPDGHYARVPVVIKIPKGAEVPDTWAFRIGVSMKVSDLTAYESTVYFLMKR